MSRIGCLVLHGFGGDVHEVLPLARALQSAGYQVECPTLEGHGMGKRHLARSTRRQWVLSAEEAYRRLSMRADKFVIIGFSMGGLIGLQLAKRFPAKKLFTVNTPYYYWDFRQMANNLRSDFSGFLKRYARSSVRYPLRSMVQFRLLLSETKQLLSQVHCPYHILQGLRDDTVKAISAEYLRKGVHSRDIRVSLFERSGHQIFLGEEADTAIQTILDDLRESVGTCP